MAMSITNSNLFIILRRHVLQRLFVRNQKRVAEVPLSPTIFHLSRPEEFSFSPVLFTYRNNGCFDDPTFQLSGPIIDFHFRESKPNPAHPHLLYKEAYVYIKIPRSIPLSYMTERKCETNSFSYEIKFQQIPGLPDASRPIRWTLILQLFRFSHELSSRWRIKWKRNYSYIN